MKELRKGLTGSIGHEDQDEDDKKKQPTDKPKQP